MARQTNRASSAGLHPVRTMPWHRYRHAKPPVQPRNALPEHPGNSPPNQPPDRARPACPFAWPANHATGGRLLLPCRFSTKLANRALPRPCGRRRPTTKPASAELSAKSARVLARVAHFSTPMAQVERRERLPSPVLRCVHRVFWRRDRRKPRLTT